MVELWLGWGFDNRGNPPLHEWVWEAKKCLVKDERARDLGKNIQICYRQPRNLKNRVTHIRKPYVVENDPGCRKCGKCRVSCPVLVEGVKFTSTNTKRTYSIKKQLNCDSSYVIYFATCKNCKGQYVGKREFQNTKYRIVFVLEKFPNTE